MRIDVFTIFPELIEGYATGSIVGRAVASGAVVLRVHDLRDFAPDAHRSVDDAPFGGGAGMVLAPGPIFDAVESVDADQGGCRPVFALTPAGRRFDQRVAAELSELPGFSLLCGRYEGIDQRVLDHCCDGELSVGDVVLAGGELAALIVTESVVRLVGGVLGNDASTRDESFQDGLLEYPQYTRPAVFRDWPVPEVLRSGDHSKVAKWRRAAAVRRTLARRPDLIEARGGLHPAELALLEEFPDAADVDTDGEDGGAQ